MASDAEKLSRARLDLSIACSKADRAARACAAAAAKCDKVHKELVALLRAIPNPEDE